MPTSPPAVTPPPAAPSTSNPTTFAGLADAFIAWLTVYQPQETALAANLYANAVEVFNNTVTVAANTAAASSAATNAAASAGAVLWVSGNTYANGVAVRSPANQRIYIKITATAGGVVDPSANATDWQLLNAEMPIVYVTTATQTILAGYRYIVIYAGICALTAPSAPNDKDEFVVVLANGFINTVDFGAKTVIGSNGSTLSGVMSLDVGTLRVEYVNSFTKWVMQ